MSNKIRSLRQDFVLGVMSVIVMSPMTTLVHNYNKYIIGGTYNNSIKCQTHVCGSVHESVSKRPLAGTQVEIIDIVCSSLMYVVSTNAYGEYSCSNIPMGEYLIKYSLGTYRTHCDSLSIISNDTTIDLGITYMVPPTLRIRRDGILSGTHLTFNEYRKLIEDHYNDLNLDDAQWQEDSDPGPLFGQVVDYWSYKPMSGVRVSLIDSMGIQVACAEKDLYAESDVDGFFVIQDVPIGQYGIRMEKVGKRVMIFSYIWDVPAGAKIVGDLTYQESDLPPKSALNFD